MQRCDVDRTFHLDHDSIGWLDFDIIPGYLSTVAVKPDRLKTKSRAHRNPSYIPTLLSYSADTPPHPAHHLSHPA